MQATVNCTADFSTAQAGQLLSISKASEFLGCHPNSLRAWSDAGQVPTVTLPSGHRRYELGQLRQFLGLDAEPELETKELEEENNSGKSGGTNNTARICCCTRVSSSKQANGFTKGKESDLTRQITTIQKYILDRFGYDKDDKRISYSTRCASGLNFNHPAFKTLCKNLLSQKFDYLICTHKDRLCRFGFEMVEILAKHANCEIVIIGDETEEKGFSESLAEDLLSIITCFSAKHYGRRSAKTCTKVVSSEAISRMLVLRRKNTSIKQIKRILEKEGFKTGHDTVITTFIIRKFLDANGIEEALTVASGYDKSKTDSTPFSDFVGEHIQLTSAPADQVSISDIRTKYARFCESKGIVAEDKRQFGKLLNSLGLKKIRKGKKGMRWVVGLRLIG